ncbi:MAG TPA: GNAT family N-acetyltransferase [Cyclobacteriaceae bacterium]|nr:GNAT family N-acetyltransferase [Cyclobacteriaceae bacterium]
MIIQREEHGSKGAFFIQEQAERQAVMTYTMAGPQRMIIDHTEVFDALRGKSAGKQLVTTAVEYARANQLKIIPLCPFAKSVFDKTPAFQDVLNQ